MTAKEQVFIQEYMIDLNATQAAIRAGYSPNTAAQIASRIMDKPYIQSAIAVEMAVRSRRTGINQDVVLRELARIALVNPLNVFDPNTGKLRDDLNDDDAAALAGMKLKKTYGDFESEEIEIKIADKVKALELLGKHLGMFEDKLRLAGDLTLNIKIDYGDGKDG